MTKIFPEYPAKDECLKFASKLDSSALGMALKEPGHGRMFGFLTCTDGTIYKAFSGLLEGEYEAPDFVPPVFDVQKMKGLLSYHDTIIKACKTSEEAKEKSRICWNEVLKLYTFHCFDGLERTLDTIFPNAPSGTGDCCAPKLISYAYSQGKKPQSLCEFFYGSGSHEHMSFHTPCDFRCKPILKEIIGLDIEYYDNSIIVVNKPSGMLSIEGHGEDKQDCTASRVKALYPNCIAQPCVHRLDQATSGLMVLGLTQEAHDALSRAFENHQVCKTYEALVYGRVENEEGTIELPIRLDPNNRPHQVVDYENGKKAVTKWRRLSIENKFKVKCTRLELQPLTGRTHQLRMHCAYGLGHPIIGDKLYGYDNALQVSPDEAPRMMLQARNLAFCHPMTGQELNFELEPDF